MSFHPSLANLSSGQHFFFLQRLLLLIWPLTLNSKWRGASKAGRVIQATSWLSVAESFYKPCPLEVWSPGADLTKGGFKMCHIGLIANLENLVYGHETCRYCDTRWNSHTGRLMLVVACTTPWISAQFMQYCQYEDLQERVSGHLPQPPGWGEEPYHLSRSIVVFKISLWILQTTSWY